MKFSSQPRFKNRMSEIEEVKKKYYTTAFDIVDTAKGEYFFNRIAAGKM